MSKKIEISDRLYERLLELQQKLDREDMDDLIDYILDKSTFLEFLD